MNIIVAVDKNWAIGKDNKLLVSIPADMKMFRQETTGKVVVMGRKTLESFPNGLPLKNRTNIVLTGNKDYNVKDAIIVHTVEELLEEIKKYPSEEVYCIGGDSVYKQLLPYCDTAHVTKIDFAYEADSYFPNLDEMPVFPEDRFVEAVVQTIKANEAYVPPYGSGATLYVRPYMFGSNPVIGVKPADEYQFRILTTPVGPYFKGGAKPIMIRVTDFDRAAPHGTGHIKAGLNYAMSLHAIMDAHRQGYDENMYLDSATRTKVEETGGANFIFVTKDNTVVTPKSDSILPSITRRSLIYVAEHYLGLKVEEREVYLDEVKDFAECGLCGTAAVISPVGKIVDHGKEICFPSGMEEMGPTTKKLYETLTGIQMGRIEAPEGWIKVIE